MRQEKLRVQEERNREEITRKITEREERKK